MHFDASSELLATAFESVALLDQQFELARPLGIAFWPRFNEFIRKAQEAQEIAGNGRQILYSQDEAIAEYVLQFAEDTAVRTGVIEHFILAMAEGFIGAIRKSAVRTPQDVDAAKIILSQMESLYLDGNYRYLHEKIVESADQVRLIGDTTNFPPTARSACYVLYRNRILLANSISRIEEIGIRGFVILRTKLEESGLVEPVVNPKGYVESVIRSGRWSFEPIPEDETTVWRYLTFPKFIALLHTSKLYFPSAILLEKFSDPAEGEFTAADRDLMETEFEDYPELRAAMLDAASEVKKVVFINSWHIRSEESAEMWATYAPAAGVAIKSTIKRVGESFADDRLRICATRVRYVDEIRDTTEMHGIYSAFTNKRNAFEYEIELRLMFVDPSMQGSGVSVPVELGKMITEVVLAPSSEPWIKPLVESLLAEKGLAVPVRLSSLS